MIHSGEIKEDVVEHVEMWFLEDVNSWVEELVRRCGGPWSKVGESSMVQIRIQPTVDEMSKVRLQTPEPNRRCELLASYGSPSLTLVGVKALLHNWSLMGPGRAGGSRAGGERYSVMTQPNMQLSLGRPTRNSAKLDSAKKLTNAIYIYIHVMRQNYINQTLLAP
ncbi:hypothetical protein BDQ17DRAFT_1490529 [Cyathus striatus]|nr:hypothetical protein BDQ17DRAFT_1490529 [Cyathus striatus]